MRRDLLRTILADPVLKRELFIQVIIATQAREGRDLSRTDAARAYDVVQRESAKY